jgi:poly(3-hydroxybutyrate) depolymerase
MSEKKRPAEEPAREHSVPWFWPFAAAIELLFKEDRLAKGAFVALGRTLELKAIRVPLYLLAGAEDDITVREQVFNAARLVGTPDSEMAQKLVPGSHIALFMRSHTRSHTLADAWPEIGRWLAKEAGR